MTAVQSQLSHRGLKRAASSLPVLMGLAIFCVWTLAPILWAIICSLLPQSALTATPPDLSPGLMTLSNYQAVLSGERDLVHGLINSAVVASFTAATALVLGSAAAYALARLHLPGANRILLMILATQMLPGIVLVIPLFIVMSRIGLIDTQLGLVIVYLSFILPVVIWVLKGFFDAVPVELDRAAAVDGATPLQTFRLIVLPISLAPLFAVGVFAFIESWNEFFFAVILTRLGAKTAPVAIAELSGEYITLFGELLAAAVLASIPVVVLAVIFRRYILQGFVEGAVKG